MSDYLYKWDGTRVAVGGETREPLPTTITLSPSYINILKTSWNAMVAETDGHYNRIPFIAYTDQHGLFNNVNAVMNAIEDNCDLSKISKIINLGDCTSNSDLAKVVAWLPLDKQINVIGNHDMEALNPLADHTPIMKYFPCGGNARQFNRNEWWTIIDDLRNVKYIVVNNFEMPAGENRYYWYQSAEQVEWFAKELAKADGYDVVILSHSYFDDGGTAYKRDGTIRNRYPTIWPWSKDTTANTAFHSLLAARKNKTSGTYTDSDGHSIPYDFTNCDSELLMALHGHDHIESYEHLTNSITDYVFECFYNDVGTNNTVYFGYIDRVAKKFKNWKLYDGITAVDVQEIDIQ